MKVEINTVNCGNCGCEFNHDIEATTIKCPACNYTSEPCDFPDVRTVLDSLSKEDRMLIDKAVDKVTIEILESLDYSDEVEISEGVILYHYSEDDVVVLNLKDEWTEVLQILWNKEVGELIYEEL